PEPHSIAFGGTPMHLISTDDHAYVGIDVAAATSTVACCVRGKLTAAPLTITHTSAGFTTLLHRLEALRLPPTAFTIVMENTSTYWMPLAVFLIQAGYAVSVVNPVQTHAFARSYLRRAKTDPLDAITLAQYAAERHPRPWRVPPDLYYELRARLLTRQRYLAIRTQLTNHDESLRHCPVVVEA